MNPNSYLAIAARNLATNKKLLEWGDYNDAAWYSQQVVEKVLMHLLETTQDAEVTKLMKLHNLKKLYTEAKDRKVKILPAVNIDTLAALTDYYFDTNYPGDNFILVEKDVVICRGQIHRCQKNSGITAFVGAWSEEFRVVKIHFTPCNEIVTQKISEMTSKFSLIIEGEILSPNRKEELHDQNHQDPILAGVPEGGQHEQQHQNHSVVRAAFGR